MKPNYFILLLISTFFCITKTYSQTEYKDVASIFFSRCTSCHHENQHAPSMMNYSETVANSGSMLNDLTINKMPPWPPDTAYSRFNHEHIITSAEKNTIINWLNNGMPAGDTTLAPDSPIYPQHQLNGTPDLILRTGAFTSNANTSDAYNCFSIPTNLLQDRILRAYEIIPGNASIVHHVVVDVDTLGTGTSDLSGTCYTNSGDFTLGFYVPGAAPVVFPGQAPLKAGVTIKAGSKFRLQIHYPAGSAGQVDSTQIRLYFYPVGTTGVRPIYTSVPLQNWSLNIPANTTRTFTSNYLLPADISVFSVGPHSHKVCTKISYYAYQATDTIPLIRINKWTFEWQGFYSFRNLLKVPVAYRLFSSHFYDNTSANLNNPHNPPQNIIAGTSTTDEMLFDGVQYLIYQPGDELIDVEGLLANDPLLTLGVNEMPVSEIQTYVYPNPVNDRLNIYVSKKAEFKINIVNITGQAILQLKSSEDLTTIDTKNIGEGVYFLEIIDVQSSEKLIKKIVISH